MSPKRIPLLALAALLMVVAAVWLNSARRPQEQAQLQQEAVPGLKERINDIDQVVVTGPGNAAIASLKRGEDAWTLEQRDYRADEAKLRSLLLGLAEARRIEAKTANPELYYRLGVEDTAADDAKGVKLELRGGGDPIALIIGQNNPRGKGTYMRIADEAQSWMLDRNIAVEKDTTAWLHRDLLDIQPSQIARLSIESGQERIEIVADDSDDGDFKLVNLPKGREPASDFVADGSAGLLQGLRFDDVAGAEAQVPTEPLRRAQFQLKNGVQIELNSWQADGKTWARLTAGLDDAAANAVIDADQAKAQAEWQAKQAAADAAPSDESATDSSASETAAADATSELAPEPPLAVADPAAHREQALAALRAEVDSLNTRFEGHAFKLPSYKADNLNRDLEAYLKPKS